MINPLHNIFCQSHSEIINWYKKKTENLSLPIYSSYDIRDAKFKVSNVDGNIYPAGFNNICPTDKESGGDLFGRYIKSHYGKSVKKIMLLTEEHTANPYYWDNVDTIKTLLSESGYEVLVAVPKDFATAIVVKNSLGKEIKVYPAYFSHTEVKNFAPDIIISNNDFSNSLLEWANQVNVPVNPPRELGWYQRKKSNYFKFYNQLVHEFSEIAKIDPFQMTVRTEKFENFNLEDLESRQRLADRAKHNLDLIQQDYLERNIKEKPFLFIKNNSGTYGLAVLRVNEPSEILTWNSKLRKKMKAAKGGNEVEELIIQEGIPSVVQYENASAEPVIYMIGCQLAGGFLRTHAEKTDRDSLNSPGAVYKKLCVSDLTVSLEGSPLENVYGWSARLGLLATALEAEELNVKFEKYQKGPCLD